MVDVSTGQNNITITVTPTSTTSEVTISTGGTSATMCVNWGSEIYAERAKTYATQAGTSATLADTSKNNSSIWAEGTDAQVQELGGLHSSKGWSEISTNVNTSLSNLNATGEAHFQAPLVSGTNIKTINNNSILGSGNVNIDALPSQTGQSGKYLTTDGSSASWTIVSDSLSGLTDITITSPSNDEVLKYDSATSKWINCESVNSLVNLTDVQISSLANNDIIIYNSTDAKFKNIASPTLSAPYIKTTYVNGESGYIIWNNGYCEQWGRASNGNHGTGIITMLKTYSSTAYSLICVPWGADGNTAQVVYKTFGRQTTGSTFTVEGWMDWHWRANGYLASGQY